MPILVRKDNGKRLRAADVRGLSGRARALNDPDYREVFVVHNERGLSVLNPESLNTIDALLEGELTVSLNDGSKVEVQTVLSELREPLKDYTLDKVSEITEVPKEQIERIAKEAATTKPLHVVYGASNYQWYHGDLKGRAISLLPVLTGNIGKSGAGLSTLAGQYRIRFNLKEWWFPKGAKLNWVPYLYFLNGGGKKYPESGIKAMIGGWGNPFDQHNMANALKKRSADSYEGDDKIEFVLITDFQMTTSCQWSDIIIPSTCWYENYELTATILHPYLQLQQPVIEPLFESKTGIWFIRELAKRLDPKLEEYFFPGMEENEVAKKVIKTLLDTGGAETEGITFEMLEKGPLRLHSTAPDDRQIPFYDQVNNRVPFPPRSYPTTIKATAKFLKSGRIEFYKDEDLFIELGEQLPVNKKTIVDTEYKMNPDAKDLYKLRFVTKNSLYRVHSTHSSNVWLNELQGNKPKMFLSEEDAKERDIKTGDFVEIFNDRGQVKASAIIDPGCRKGNIIFEQGWWSRCLMNESYNSLTQPWINPLHEIYFVPGIWTPTTVWNECLVDVRRVDK